MDARGVTGDRSLMGNGRISATSSIQLFLRGDSYPSEPGNGGNVSWLPPSHRTWRYP